MRMFVGAQLTGEKKNKNKFENRKGELDFASSFKGVASRQMVGSANKNLTTFETNKFTFIEINYFI